MTASQFTRENKMNWIGSTSSTGKYQYKFFTGKNFKDRKEFDRELTKINL